MHDAAATDNCWALSYYEKSKKGNFFLLPLKVKAKADKKNAGYIYPHSLNYLHTVVRIDRKIVSRYNSE